MPGSRPSRTSRGATRNRIALKRCRTLIEGESETSQDIKEAQVYLDQNMLARYAAVSPAPRFWIGCAFYLFIRAPRT